MLGNAAVYATSRTQDYVALAEGAKGGMFVRSVMSFMQPNVYEITLEGNEGAKKWRKTLSARAGVSTSM